MTDDIWWILPFPPCFSSSKDPKNFCYKLDVGFNFWITSSFYFRLKIKGDPEYAHLTLGTKQDIFTFMSNSQDTNSALYMTLVASESAF